MGFWQAFPSDRLLVEASLWSADFTRFGDEIRRVDAYADLYHIDVSDGHFVPGLLFFADLVAGLRPLTRKPFHVHLMTDNPLAFIPDFIQAGANLITVHAENGPLAFAALDLARRMGAAGGLSLGLDVPPEQVLPFLDQIELVLMMGTPMGVKGVEPSRLAAGRVQRLRQLIDAEGYGGLVKIAADGGIRQHTVPLLRAAGADLVIGGSLVFKSTDLAATFAWLHGLPGPGRA
jgi:ribulose-phosphate 3-epimerase